MSCERFEELVYRQSEDLLDHQESATLEAHLGQCASCARLACELAAIGAALDDMPREAPPVALARVVAARVRAAASRQPAQAAPLWLRLAPAALALAVVLAGLGYVWLIGADGRAALAILPDSPGEAVRTAHLAYQEAVGAPQAISHRSAAWWAQTRRSFGQFTVVASQQSPPGLLYCVLGLLVLANGLLYVRRPQHALLTESW